MWTWKESIEHCFFTAHLDEDLKEFLKSKKPFSNDQECWEYLHTTACVWKQSCLVDFDSMMMPSFFQPWNINAFFNAS